MHFDLQESLQILERTPHVLRAQLSNLNDDWILSNEGHETFSPFDVLGHLVHGENTDWIPRVKAILENWNEGKFEPFDRFAHYEESKGKDLQQLLDEFQNLRKRSIEFLKSSNISESDLEKTGIHPAFGQVTLKQLLSTWTVHDLAHMSQINRVMAKQYKEEVGPWLEYFRILQ